MVEVQEICKYSAILKKVYQYGTGGEKMMSNKYRKTIISVLLLTIAAVYMLTACVLKMTI